MGNACRVDVGRFRKRLGSVKGLVPHRQQATAGTKR